MHVRELIWSEPAAAVRRLAHLPLSAAILP